MDLRNKKKKLSIHVILNPCKASGDEIYSLAIRVLYCRKKKEYSLGRQVHRSNYRVDGERVVYSPEGILKRRDPGSINRLIMEGEGGDCEVFSFFGEDGAGVWFGASDAETSQGAARPVCGKVHFAIYRLFERGREAGNSRCLYERVAFSVAFLQSAEDKVQGCGLCFHYGLHALFACARGCGEHCPHVPQQFQGDLQQGTQAGGEGWQGQSVCRFGHSQAGDGETGFEQGGNSTHRFGQSQAASPVGAGAGFVYVQFLLSRHVVCGCHSS